MALKVTHSKTLANPDNGSEDKVYGSDYVSPSSHTLTGVASGAQGGLGADFSGVTGFPLFTAGVAAGIGSTGTGNVVRASAPTVDAGIYTGLSTFSTITGVPDSTSTSTQNVVYWSIQATATPGSTSTSTYVGIRGEVNYVGTAGLNAPGHIVGNFGHAVMNATGQTLALGIGTEGKIIVNAGTATSMESLRGSLEDVIAGTTLTAWTGCHVKIADCNGTLTTGIAFDFSGITVSGAAAGTLIGFRCNDITTAQATIVSAFKSNVLLATGHWGFDESGGANNRFLGNSKFGSVAVPSHFVDIGAGTATVAPILMTSGTNLTTATAGASEFDGTCFYKTAVASSRQVEVTEQFAVNTAAVGLTNGTGAQTYLQSGSTTLTVAASTTYEFEALIEIEGMAGASHTTAFAFGGNASFTDIQYMSISWSGAAAAAVTTVAHKITQVATSTVVVSATTAAASTIFIKGVMRINGAGTIIPQIAFSADPTGTITATKDCYFKLYPKGSNTVQSVGNWA